MTSENYWDFSIVQNNKIDKIMHQPLYLNYIITKSYNFHYKVNFLFITSNFQSALQVRIMKKHVKQKSNIYLTVKKRHSSSKQKSNHKTKSNVLVQSKQLSHVTSKAKYSMKTSLDQRLKVPDDFGLIPDQKRQKILKKSSQQSSKKAKNNNLFKNTQIKKSIELHKNNTDKQKYQIQSLTNQQKQHRDAYYGNTTTSHTKSNKYSSKSNKGNSKLSDHSDRNSLKPNSITSNSKLHSKLSVNRNKSQNKGQIVKKTLKSPHNSGKKIELELSKKRQQRRGQKIQQQYLLMLEQKLQKKQAEYNTMKTRNILQLTKGLGGWVDSLNDQEIRRLRKIYRTQQQIYELKLKQIKNQIQSLTQDGKNQMFCFNSNYDQCQDIISWIEAKD